MFPSRLINGLCLSSLLCNRAQKGDNFANMKLDLKKELPLIQEWIRQTVGNASVVVGVSGGKDSSVVAALCVAALGKERVYGVLMPCHKQSDIDKSLLLVKTLGIDYEIIDIGPAYDALTAEIKAKCGKGDLPITYTSNTPARLRMTTLYGVAALLGNARVVNTCNLSEDYVGYSTKFGDAAGDFSPLSRFTCHEVIELGELLGLPNELTHKAPTDGMCGLTDEDRFGFTYATLDAYIRDGVLPDEKTLERIESMHRAGLHKLRLMPTYEPEAN